MVPPLVQDGNQPTIDLLVIAGLIFPKGIMNVTTAIYFASCLACFFAGFAAGVAVQTWRSARGST